MGAFIEENSIALLSIVTVDHSSAAQTTLLTVPSGFRCIIDHVKIEAAGDFYRLNLDPDFVCVVH